MPDTPDAANASEKAVYLRDIFTAYGDYELWFVKGYDPETKKAVPGWPSWKMYSQCDRAEIEQANLRSILKEEIVLDIEDPARYEPIAEELKQLPVTFSAFATGSRGHHVHIVFDQLRNTDNNQASLIKKAIIAHFKADQSKHAERNLIAIEHEPHFKTGRQKHQVDARLKGKNDLNLFLATTVKLDEVRKAPKFNDIYTGDWQKWGFPSRSEAEESLCCMLAAAGFNAAEIWAVMDTAKVGKWRENTDNYKDRTIRHAIELVASRPALTEGEALLNGESLFRFIEDFGVPEPPSWLWPRYIPSKGVTIFAGAPGCGKSFVSEELVSAILNKRKAFGVFEVADDRPIILIDMENDHSTLYERLQKLGGIPPEKLLVFNFEYNFDIVSDVMLQELLAQVERYDPCMVILDTLRRTYSGDENDSKIINAIYKRGLAPIAKKRCCLLIAHTRKASNSPKAVVVDELSEIRGTGDIVGLASAVHMLRKNCDDSITVKTIKMRQAKSSEPFTVKVVTDGDKLRFEFLGMSQTVLTEAEILANKIFEWLRHNKQPMEQVKTREILKGLSEEDPRRIREALPMLIGKGVLHRERKGIYTFTHGDESLSKFTGEEEGWAE